MDGGCVAYCNALCVYITIFCFLISYFRPRNAQKMKFAQLLVLSVTIAHLFVDVRIQSYLKLYSFTGSI